MREREGERERERLKNEKDRRSRDESSKDQRHVIQSKIYLGLYEIILQKVSHNDIMKNLSAFKTAFIFQKTKAISKQSFSLV